MRFILLVFALLLGSAQANPAQDLKMVGSGTFNFMFWKIYDISLLTASGSYSEGEQPLALAITYARDIEGKQLVSTTIDEWERQDINWQENWSTRLMEIFPDITEGDQLLLRVDEQYNSNFYFNEQPIGVIEDSAFTDAFLAIWLSSDTRSQKLTRELTGAL